MSQSDESETTDQHPPLVYLGQETEETSPRTLIRRTVFEPDGAVAFVAYIAAQPSGTTKHDEYAKEQVIGFAEFPKNKPIKRTQDREEFEQTVEGHAVYYHWKPEDLVNEVTLDE